MNTNAPHIMNPDIRFAVLVASTMPKSLTVPDSLTTLKPPTAQVRSFVATLMDRVTPADSIDYFPFKGQVRGHSSMVYTLKETVPHVPIQAFYMPDSYAQYVDSAQVLLQGIIDKAVGSIVRIGYSNYMNLRDQYERDYRRLLRDTQILSLESNENRSTVMRMLRNESLENIAASIADGTSISFGSLTALREILPFVVIGFCDSTNPDPQVIEINWPAFQNSFQALGEIAYLAASQFGVAGEHITDIHQQLAESRQQLAESQQENEALNGCIRTQRQTIAEVKQDRDAWRTECKTLRGDKAALERDNASLREERAVLRSANRRLAGEVAEDKTKQSLEAEKNYYSRQE